MAETPPRRAPRSSPPTVLRRRRPVASTVVNGHRRIPPSRSGPESAPAVAATAPRSTLQRRTLLQSGLGGLGLLATGAFVAACGSTDDTTRDGISAGPDETLTALFPRDIAYLAPAVPFRLTYTLTDVEGVPLMELPGPMTFRVERDGVPVGDPAEVAPHGDGVPRPYLPFTFTFPEPGLYDVYASRGDLELNNQVIVSEPGEVVNPLVGQVLPPTATPTVTQSFDVDPICTLTPQCPFHEHDLSTVLGTGRPVVVLLASPAYCRTTACGPILNILMEQAAALPEDAIVIHAEVYKNPKAVQDLNDAVLAPLPTDYQMGFEPCLWVTDRANLIVARGDIVVDRTEMAQMLALAR
jgi:hypothetical protein